MRRSAENKLRVVAVRIDPVIEQRLRVLAEATGRKQTFFLQRMIEDGIDAMEEVWLSPDTLAKVRNGDFRNCLPNSTRPRICSTWKRPTRAPSADHRLARGPSKGVGIFVKRGNSQ
jgi:RHH-type transcriptional regulator, rel operon repressor / antitoxin RelB